jgi:hypothetical protein
MSDPTVDRDAPSPPGSPMRRDTADAPHPAGHDDEASASEANDETAERAGGHRIPLEDEQPHSGADPGTEPGEEDLQEESAGTSLDQPSQ